MRNLVLLIVLFNITLLLSCDRGFQKGAEGILYKIYKNKAGKNIQEDDFVHLNAIVKTDKGSMILSSYDLGQAFNITIEKQTNNILYPGILLLSEGDSASIKVHVDSAAKRSGQAKPPDFKGQYYVYDLKIEKVIPKNGLTDQQFRDTVMKFIEQQVALARKEEPAKINKYIEENMLQVTRTSSGLNYVITKEGTGIKPLVGDTVKVNYTGKLISGKVFDTNNRETAKRSRIFHTNRHYEPLKVVVGQRQVIEGWDEVLQLLRKGTKARVIIPSKLAYGDHGAGPIPPISPLVFDIELTDVMKPVASTHNKVVPAK